MTVDIAEERLAGEQSVAADPTDPADASRGARLLHGAPIAAEIRAALTQKLDRLRETNAVLPGVSVVLVGDDPASAVYAGRILTNAQRLGLPGRHVRLPTESTTQEIA